jgi:hypothetical protein
VIYFIAILDFCDTCAGYEFMLMQEVAEALSSDDQMLCFRHKAHCKSDKVVRLPRFYAKEWCTFAFHEKCME